VLDPRLSGHALEQQRIAPVVAKLRLCEAAKGVMNVIGRHRRRDAIDVCCLQRTFSVQDCAKIAGAAAMGES
jgi:hypothetical protein